MPASDLACAAVVAIAGATAVIGVNSPIVDHPAVYVTLRVASCLGMVALALVTRRSNHRLAALLLAVGCGFAVGGLTASARPGLFLVGRVAVALTILLFICLWLAYPGGRITDRIHWVLIRTAGAGFAALLAGNLLLTRVPPVSGPFVRCTAGECPPNPLNVFELPSAGRALSTALALWTAMALAATAILIARRLRGASRLQRRSLAPALTWAALVTLAYAFFIAVRAVDARGGLVSSAAVVVAAVIAALPLAIAVGMVHGRVLAMSGLEHMIAELGEHPRALEVQHTMARAFQDPTLKLLVWRPSTQGYINCEGDPSELPAPTPARQVTCFTRRGRPVAAVTHDPALTDERDVLRAAGSAVMLVLDNTRLNGDLGTSIAELAASRERLASAADKERRRIEQDLHDGAQQGLIALRIKLGLLEDLAADDGSPLAPLLADAGKQVEVTLEQIRTLARGIYPPVLRDLGLGTALSAVARELPLAIAVHIEPDRRFAPEIEAAVYFCCVEALQNVGKHCGPRVAVNVRLVVGDEGITVVVADDGPGFDPALITTAASGLTGMRDRLAVVHGTLEITSAPGRGTTVTGRIPAAAF